MAQLTKILRPYIESSINSLGFSKKCNDLYVKEISSECLGVICTHFARHNRNTPIVYLTYSVGIINYGINDIVNGLPKDIIGDSIAKSWYDKITCLMPIGHIIPTNKPWLEWIYSEGEDPVVFCKQQKAILEQYAIPFISEIRTPKGLFAWLTKGENMIDTCWNYRLPPILYYLCGNKNLGLRWIHDKLSVQNKNLYEKYLEEYIKLWEQKPPSDLSFEYGFKVDDKTLEQIGIHVRYDNYDSEECKEARCIAIEDASSDAYLFKQYERQLGTPCEIDSWDTFDALITSYPEWSADTQNSLVIVHGSLDAIDSEQLSQYLSHLCCSCELLNRQREEKFDIILSFKRSDCNLIDSLLDDLKRAYDY